MAGHPDHDQGGSRAAAVLRVTSGNFLEMFDFFAVRLLRLLHRQGVLPQRERVRLADADLHDLRRRLPDAPARGGAARAPMSTGSGAGRGSSSPWRSWPPARPDRLGARLRHPRPPGARPGAGRPPAPGLLGRRRARRRLGLPRRAGAPGPQGLLRRLAVGQPAGGDHGGGGHRLRAQPPAVAGRDGRLGLAHPVPHRLPARAVPVLHPALAAGDPGLPGPQGPPAGGRRCCAPSARELADRRARHADGGDDHDRVLRHHGLHADLRQERPQALRHRQPDRHLLRRGVEPVLAPRDGGALRPDRPPRRSCCCSRA